jgi:O-antigen/teichoic acid export membrane protein
MRVYVAIFATVAMTLSALGPELVGLLAPASYGAAARALPALAFTATAEMIQRIAGLGADLAKRTRVWVFATLVTAGVAFPTMISLLPRIGLAATGIALVAGNAVAAILVYRIACRFSEIVLPMARTLAIVGAGSILGTVIAWQPAPLLARFLVLLAFGAVTFWVLDVRTRSILTAIGRGEAGMGAGPEHAPISDVAEPPY